MKCLFCGEEIEGEEGMLFCSNYCRNWFISDMEDMVELLKKDVDLVEVYDLAQSLLKKEALGE